MFVESTHLPAYVTKRKPGVILVELESCKKWLGVEESGTFKRCKGLAGESQGTKGKRKAVKQKEKRSWAPIVQFWEFKKVKNLKGLSNIFRLAFDINSLIPSTSSPAGESHLNLCHERPLRWK